MFLRVSAAVTRCLEERSPVGNSILCHAVRNRVQITFNEILIIESLPRDEYPRTGTQLYNHLLAEGGMPVAVTLAEPQTAVELFSVLDQAALRAEAGGWVPLIHFEMHGTRDHDALVTASGERVAWNDVAEPLRHLNIAVRNALIVVLGVCSGAFIGTAAANSPLEPAPFSWLVGPDRPVLSFYLPVGFKAFYAELLTTGDFPQAVAELRRQALPEYGAYDTATLFRKAREVYLRTQAQRPVLNQRVKRIFRQRRHVLVAEYGGNNQARAAIARQIQDMSERWDEYYRHFIMADRFPENEGRFPPIGP